MKVIIYALAAVLAVPSTLGQHHTHTRRLGVVNEQAAMSIDMITDAMSMQSTAAVEPNDGPVYPVFSGKGGKSGGHGGPTPITSGKGGKSGSGPTAPTGSGKGGKSGPTAPSDGSSKSGKSATTTQATSPGTTGGTTSGTDPTTPDTTVMTTDATTPGTPTPPDTTVMTTDATTPGTPTPPDTTVMTTSPPPAGECTINSSGPPFSSRCDAGDFCCTPTNPDTPQGPTTCVNNISGQPCGPGPAQLDMCTEPPGGSASAGSTPCDPSTQQCCKDANTDQEFCCVPDLEPVGLSCLSVPSGYCDLPEVFRDNGILVFLLGLILQALGLFDGNRRNLRSVVDERGMGDIIAKVASLLNEEEGGLEGVMAKVSELGVDADMMNQLVNFIGN